MSGTGSLYYIASFFAIATQAVWSATHLTLERLGTAVAIYTAFGLVSLGVPIVARRASRPLQPAWGSGAVLLLGLGLLFFISAGPVAPAALWALALLLAITNAALFVESAAGRLPIVSQVGSVISWIVLMTWWERAAGSVGVLPSLLVAVGLTLVTLAGHSWSVRSVQTRRDRSGAVCPRALPGAHRSSVPAGAGDGSRVVVAAVAGVCGACRHHARHERRGALEPGRHHARGRHDCRRGRRHGVERQRR